MSSLRKYRVVVKWKDKRWGPQTEKLAAEGTSARRALNNALLAFFSDKSRRKERLEAHRQMQIEIWRTKEPAIGQGRTCGAAPARRRDATRGKRETSTATS